MGALLQSYIHFGLLFSWLPPIFLRDAFFMPYFVCRRFPLGASCVRVFLFDAACITSPSQEKGKETQHLLRGKALDDTFLLRPCAWDANAPMLRRYHRNLNFEQRPPRRHSFGNFY